MRARAAMAAAVVAAAALLAPAAPAQAVAYRYWTYWQGTAQGWVFATAGPASTIPADGSVEGWRFAVTTAAGAPGDQPRVAPSFADVCARTPAAPGGKRVALVIDPGPPAMAPNGQSPGPVVAACVVADPGATGYQVLRSVAEVRTDGGLVCAITGYPAGECAPVVEAPAVSGATLPAEAVTPTVVAAPGPAPGPDAGAGAPWATLLVLLVGGAAGLVMWRRRHG
ncbi:MAG: SCO2322 family protein [Candidatus Nanopelagicales bacterium]